MFLRLSGKGLAGNLVSMLTACETLCKGDDDAGFTLLGEATPPGSRKNVQSHP